MCACRVAVNSAHLKLAKNSLPAVRWKRDYHEATEERAKSEIMQCEHDTRLKIRMHANQKKSRWDEKKKFFFSVGAKLCN